MPLYDYDCANCGERFEVLRGVHAEPPPACVLCGGGPVKKAFTTPAIHFKGSGWAKKERHASSGRSASKAGRDDGSAAKDAGQASKGGAEAKDGGSARGDSKESGSGVSPSSGDSTASGDAATPSSSSKGSHSPSSASTKADRR